MSSQSSQHHSFDIYLAKIYGLPEAILIHHLAHWIREHRAKKEHFIEGRTWNYMSYEDVCARYPYFTYDQVRRAFERLEQKLVIIKGKFNKRKGDNTLWFAFQNEERFVPFFSAEEKRSFYEDVAKMPGVWQKCQGSGKNATALPDTKPDTEPKNNSPLPSQEGLKRKKSSPVIKKERDIEVRTSDLEHTTLLEKYEGSEEKVKNIYREYAIWKQEKGVTGGNDWKVLKNWILSENDQKRTQTAKKSIIDSNRTVAMEIMNELKKTALKFEIEAFQDSIQITDGPYQPFVLKYSENGFEEQLRNRLRKMGVT